MPSNRLHKAKVLSHISSGRGYYRIVLKAPEAAVAALPGQFVMLRVSDNLDPLLARPFGIFSIPSKTTIEIMYRVVGRGTMLLSRVEAGYELAMLGPLGKGFPAPEKGAVPVMVAGGSGFPPLHFLAARTDLRNHIFVGAANKECLPPPVVLKSFREHAVKIHVATEDGSSGKKGVVTDLVSAFLDGPVRRQNAVVYACGPHAMLAATARIAAANAIPCYVSMEERMACGLGACMGCSIPMKAGGYKRACKEGPVFDSRDIDWSERVVLPVPHIKK